MLRKVTERWPVRERQFLSAIFEQSNQRMFEPFQPSICFIKCFVIHSKVKHVLWVHEFIPQIKRLA